MASEALASLDAEMVELPLLMPTWQAVALESAAHSNGMTTGQMARRIIQDYFGKFAQPRPFQKG